ncbi:cysteine proteinases superfamily protein isoform X2 [Tasmannia lanceolata]|uniref:cysteine proteinases superfamily protein isoform X2 n=1 Tax=Tasmannia lanceolata TaxID=3420 RepID=UPI004062AA92
MILSMDLNASPLPEDDEEETFEEHVEEETTVDGNTETSVEIYRREREERRCRLKREHPDEGSKGTGKLPKNDSVAQTTNPRSFDKTKLPQVSKQRFSRTMTRQAAQECTEIPSPCFSDTYPHHEKSKRVVKSRPKFLKELNMIDTNMFQSHLEKIWRPFSKKKKRYCAYLDCLWFSLYTKGWDKNKVLMWIQRKRIFIKKYVFIPIICWGHWSLLILCHFGARLESKTRKPCMLLLDSLNMTDPKRLEPDIRKFVLDIYRTEGRCEDKELISKIPLLVPKRNGEECGIFILYFIKLFLQSAPKVFSISEGYPYFLNENWFDFESLESFCEKMEIVR